MNRSFTMYTVGVATVILSLVPVFGIAASAPKVEPKTVFMTGPAPSWTTSHSNASTPEHRQYHKNAVEAFQTWMAAHKTSLSMGEYKKELRAVLAKRDHDHRAFHGWDKETEAQIAWRMAHPNASATVTKTVATMKKEDAYSLYADNFKAMFEERRFEGARPSARTIHERASFRKLPR